VSLEGVPLITSFARSSVTGWTVAAGIAESSLVGPLWRNLAITSVIGGMALLIGLAFAVRMATTIARGEMLHDLLIEELNHRVKNTLAILQSLATQTFRSASKTEREKFEGRLGALAEAHNLLSKEKWQGSELQDEVGRVLQPYLLNSPERVRMFGPKIPLSPRLAVVLSMIIHEIATNAAKYGALSNDTGTVALDWEAVTENGKPKLRLVWAEAGGPLVTAPVQRGFGSRLIERSARDQLGGEATVDFLPRGVPWSVRSTTRASARSGPERPRWRKVGTGCPKRCSNKTHLPEILQARKRLQQPDADGRDRAGQKADAGNHHQHAHRPLDIGEMPFHAREQRGELFDHQGRDKKGDAKAGGIDREQPRALCHRRLGRSHREDGGEDRADAGCPAERKRQSHHIGPPQADGLGDGQPPFPHQEADPRQPEEMQAHGDDDDAGDNRKLGRPGADQCSDQGGAGAERHEHGGKSEHEHDRRYHHRTLRRRHRLFILEVLDGRAREVDQIRRHQRQHARRQKTDQAGNQRRGDRDIMNHAVVAIMNNLRLAALRQARGESAG
jgi:two-component sensor histidine kinase